MTIAHLLEDFAMNTSAEPALPAVSEELIEEQRLASFENGYSAGWDDAVTAKDQESSRISTELANSLEDLSFTYHEAQSQLLDSLDPMFKVLTSAVLPDAMAASFGHHIVDQLADMAKGQTDQPMQIVVAPGEAAPVRSLLPDNFSVPVTVQEDSVLSPGQAYLRIGSTECEINCDALLESIQDSIEAFTYHAKEDSQYG
ncbi:ABC transporter ATP-binding protein [Leisingera sp. M527]|uniref:ABC transporter ATP-binding protein n=1 Tax=unclassified Leisingera TaxID=2614906 RepID=UPI001F3D39CE|nr:MULTISPECIES: ABC transporter ATP-binding protein [unclassified Leisingera]MCF6433066.1 ABC transporter ATP-binding protein [Leisingera sp. MMG026]UWQ32885.1 ABC transporter ATP-binding protein [Leisingera sp. M527]UWQ74840.1 ABC transporter ATP-binding protein [Leisingera sp. M658]